MCSINYQKSTENHKVIWLKRVRGVYSRFDDLVYTYADVSIMGFSWLWEKDCFRYIEMFRLHVE
jgi:hypothetical protein